MIVDDEAMVPFGGHVDAVGGVIERADLDGADVGLDDLGRLGGSETGKEQRCGKRKRESHERRIEQSGSRVALRLALRRRA